MPACEPETTPGNPYDSDQDPDEDDAHRFEPLHWDLDPEESFSDWTIEVLSENEANLKIYHVHRNIIAVGPGRSEYFVRLLLGHPQQFMEQDNRTSRFTLHPLAASVFSVMLDFMCGKPVKINTQSAVPLAHLAVYFDVRHLRYEVKMFWTTNLTLETATTYYEHARIFGHDKIHQAIVNMCAMYLESVQTTSELVKLVQPDFWLAVVRQKRRGAVYPQSQVLHLSCRVARVLEVKRQEIDVRLFQELTSADSLPMVSIDAVQQLLEAEAAILKTLGATKISNLQGRCLNALAWHWRHVDVTDAKALNWMAELNPMLVAELWRRYLRCAQLSCAKMVDEARAAAKTIEELKKDISSRDDEIASLKDVVDHGGRRHRHW